ncbi:DinB family protein, partial [Mycolicibacter arupensis]|uniref:DinB family protein n=1 Tax=Mycolicibacter arupensis TaxID=342002 RepID=UPI003B3B47FC
TTIAWRMAHVIVGVFAMRNHHHFGGPPADPQSWPYAVDAATALRPLDDAYAGWIAGLRALDGPGLARPIGPAEGPWAQRSMAELILHIHREAIHHGAEIALLRDLYLRRLHRKD